MCLLPWQPAWRAALPRNASLFGTSDAPRGGASDWSQREEAPQGVKQWEDDWDDDSVTDDFAKQLRAELEKQATKAG